MKISRKLKSLLVLLSFALVLVGLNSANLQRQLVGYTEAAEPVGSFALQAEGALASDALFAEAFRLEHSGVYMAGEGRVLRLLPDDTKGSRHQRFLVALESGQTLMIVHNIDLAAPVADLRLGAAIEFAGDYEWNAKGGLVHWTHRDPQGRHPGGWIKYDGRVYQ
jgi:hypothetical protein